MFAHNKVTTSLILIKVLLLYALDYMLIIRVATLGVNSKGLTVQQPLPTVRQSHTCSRVIVMQCKYLVNCDSQVANYYSGGFTTAIDHM